MNKLSVKQNYRITLEIVFIVLLMISKLSMAVTDESIDIKRGSSHDQPLDYELPPADRSTPVLPELPPIPIPQGEGAPLSTQPEVFVKKIVFEGNQVFSEETLREEITHSYENRSITAEELQEIRNKISLYYYDKGYINSGAVIHDQRVEAGVIKIGIIEGKLADIKISSEDKGLWLRDGYIRRQVEGKKDSVLNINELHERLQLLQQNQLIKTINAELAPGLRLGEAILDLRIREERPYGLDFRFNNHRSPSVGAYRGELSGWHRNVSGWGDSFYVRYGITEGLKDYTLEYTLPVPINGRDSTFSVYAEQSDSEVVTEPFKRLDIESEAEKYGVSFNYLWKKTLQKQYGMGIKVEKRRSKTFLLGDPFSYSPGPNDGESDISVVRWVQDWLYRTRDKVIAGRSSFNFGIDAWDPTINHDGSPDSKFFSWLGQFQWVERLGLLKSHLLFRTDAQWSREDLLPLEKISIGGATTVRGYRENQITGDNGFVMSLEWRIPLFEIPVPFKSEDSNLYIAPFFDYGRAWNADSDTLEPKDISSIGLGLRWAPSQRFQTEVYWGKALRDIPEVEDDDLQDKGIHFEMSLQW